VDNARQKMLDKIRAIMAKTMANGCTEDEAVSALDKARELMAAYDIAESELGNTRPQEGAIIFKQEDVNDPYQIKRWLASGVGKFTQCKVWRNLGTGGMVFCGLESEALFADWLLTTLQSFVMRELRAYQLKRKRQGFGCPRIASSSFVYACANRISERLKEMAPKEPVGPATAALPGNALVQSRKALIEATLKAAGMHFKKARKSNARIDANSYAAGHAAGNNARFDRPVAHGGGAARIGRG
jgi:hypothetical protein